MFKRNFELYANEDGAYEILPKNYSFYALFFQFFWAIVNGTFLRYFVLGLPFPVLGFIAEQNAFGSYLFLAYTFFAFALFYPARFSTWRSKKLLSKGYKLVLETQAKTAKEVLSNYANLSTTT